MPIMHRVTRTMSLNDHYMSSQQAEEIFAMAPGDFLKCEYLGQQLAATKPTIPFPLSASVAYPLQDDFKKLF